VACAAACLLPSARGAAPPTGWVRPRLAPPALTLMASDGATTPLASLLTGSVTALQLMFTGCSTSCPVQGALFASLAARLPASGFRLLSISVDPLGDSPAALSQWLGRFGRPLHWSAAVPSVPDADRVASFLRGVPATAGLHTAQVFVADRQGRLCYRTGDAPGVGELTALLAHVALGG
jgi:protein SCO1